jgi:hypothetical protein
MKKKYLSFIWASPLLRIGLRQAPARATSPESYGHHLPAGFSPD